MAAAREAPAESVRYEVVGAVAVLRVPGQESYSERYFYRGAVVDGAGVLPESIDHHVKAGIIRAVKTEPAE